METEEEHSASQRPSDFSNATVSMEIGPRTLKGIKAHQQGGGEMAPELKSMRCSCRGSRFGPSTYMVAHNHL